MGPDGRDGHTRRECTNASEFSVLGINYRGSVHFVETKSRLLLLLWSKPGPETDTDLSGEATQ